MDVGGHWQLQCAALRSSRRWCERQRSLSLSVRRTPWSGTQRGKHAAAEARPALNTGASQTAEHQRAYCAATARDMA